MVLGSGIRDSQSSAELRIGCVKSPQDANSPCKKIIAIESFDDGISHALGQSIEPASLTPKAILEAFTRSVSDQSIFSLTILLKAFSPEAKGAKISAPTLSLPEKFDASSLIDNSVLEALKRKDVTEWQLRPVNVSTSEYRRIRAFFSGGTGKSLMRGKNCVLSRVSYATDGYNTFEENINAGLYLRSNSYQLSGLSFDGPRPNLPARQTAGLEKSIQQSVEKLLVQSRIGSFVDLDPELVDAPELVFMSAGAVLCGTVRNHVASAPFYPCGAQFRMVLRKNPRSALNIGRTGGLDHPEGTLDQPELNFWISDDRPRDKRKMWPKIGEWVRAQLGCEKQRPLSPSGDEESDEDSAG